MIYIHMIFPKKTTPLHSTHSTELFKIFFSLLTLFTAFLQKASGRGNNYSLFVALAGNAHHICKCVDFEKGMKIITKGKENMTSQKIVVFLFLTT